MEAMSSPDGDHPNSQGAAFPWVLEHLLAYPGTYEIPLRTMYTLNAAAQNQNQQKSPTQQNSAAVFGNAFPKKNQATIEEQQTMTTITAAAQLRANLMSHISQLPSQPTSLPPSFITSFVRRCFPAELDQVDFPQALTALDYLKDLEHRRRREVVAALDKLGIERDDIGHRDKLARKYPGVLRWVMEIEEKERKIEALYTQVYVGLRRWTLINEMSLTPFNKANCIALVNTLYPPLLLTSTQFVPPTAQLTAQILQSQRDGFLRYITAVEKNGTAVLSILMDQYKKPGDATGWTPLRETLDNYVRMANSVIEECYEITGRGPSPTASSFSSAESEEDGRRKVDSAISFGSAGSSNRNSAQSQKSHTTRPSTSSSFSNDSRNHSRQVSRDKQLLEKPLPPLKDEDVTLTQKTSGSALERIARELRKMKSRNNVREEPRPRAASTPVNEVAMTEGSERPPPTPSKGLKSKLSIRRMRSTTALAESGGVRSLARNGEQSPLGMPAYDADEMNKNRQRWESQQKPNPQTSAQEMNA